MNVEKEKDYLETLDRTQQVIIFRVRTGHCRLLSHLYRLRLAHTDECPCGTDSQTPEHILQSCPSHNTLRQETWPYPVDLNEKLCPFDGQQISWWEQDWTSEHGFGNAEEEEEEWMNDWINV